MPNDLQKDWWKFLLGGIVLMCFSGYIFWDLSNWEQTGESRRLNRMIAGLYMIGGKWAASGFFALVGLGVTILGAKLWRER